jgi:hypothetical protein
VFINWFTFLALITEKKGEREDAQLLRFLSECVKRVGWWWTKHCHMEGHSNCQSRCDVTFPLSCIHDSNLCPASPGSQTLLYFIASSDRLYLLNSLLFLENSVDQEWWEEG